MSSPDILRSRIEELVQAAKARRGERRATVEQEMTAMEQWQARLDAFAEEWLEKVVLPKLRTLSEAFPNSTMPAHLPSSPLASLVLARNDEFPASVQVDVGLVPDLTHRRSCLTFDVRIVPVLMDYAKGSSIEIDIEAPDRIAIESFLDEQMVDFVKDYLRINEPDSPYQRDRQVTDPVCGMTFTRAEAAGAAEYGHRTYYFCAPRCHERFEATPQRYARG